MFLLLKNLIGRFLVRAQKINLSVFSFNPVSCFADDSTLKKTKKNLHSIVNCCPLLLYPKNDSIDRFCRQTSHSEGEQALQRRLDEVTSELRTERSKSGSLQATLEKSQQDNDALAGEKGQRDTPRFSPDNVELLQWMVTAACAL